MPNEKEVKDAASEGRSRNPEPWCSATDSPCECVAGGGCQALRGKLDEVPKATVRHLRSARLYLEAAKDHLDEIQDEHLQTRRFPGPEVREVRRKVVTAQALIDEIGGDLK